jgi:hypothetical protein
VPVLIFDQVEEVVALDGADPIAARQVEVLWTQLANLVENRGPGAIGQLNLPSADFRPERIGFKVVVSLRQDYLPQLLQRRGMMPSLARNHFVLKPWKGRNAVEAVLGPGRGLMDPADADKLAEEIVRRVARESIPPSEKPGAQGGAGLPLDELRVEPALLSFFCRQLNEARNRTSASAIGAGLMTAKLVESESERIFDDFFQRSGKTQNAPEAIVPQIPQLEGLAKTEQDELPAPAPVAPPPEPLVAEAMNRAVEESAESARLAQEAPMPMQIQTAALTEQPAMEELALPASEPEFPPAEPLSASVVGHAVNEFAQDSNGAQDGAPLAQPQSAELKGRPAPVEKEIPAPKFDLPAADASPAKTAGHPARRLKVLAYAVVLMMTVILTILVVMYVQELQKQQTEAELEEYISNLATAKKTFKSAKKKLNLAESDLALKQSNIMALVEKTRAQELEAQAATQQNSRLTGEQTNFQSRIRQLNREKAEAESRLAQWSGLLYELTNQIATLNRQKEELKARNDVLAVTNIARVTNAAEPRPSPAPLVAESKEARAMEQLPARLPATAMPDSQSSSRRQVAVLSTNGQCLYSEDGTKFHVLQLHDGLSEGAVLRTGPGSWSDFFIRRTGVTVRLAPASELKIAKLSEAAENGVPVMDTLLELRQGRIFTVVRALTPGSTIEISDATGHSVIAGGGLGCYMITAPGAEGADKLLLTPLRVVGQKGTSIVTPGQGYGAKDGAVMSLVASPWETMLIQLDELEAETDKAMAEPEAPKTPIKN